MITIHNIETAKFQTELDELVESAAAERNCDLDNSHSYAESAEWYNKEAANPVNYDSADSFTELAEILRAAESKWFELGQ